MSRINRLAHSLVRVADSQSRMKGILSKNEGVDPAFLKDLASVDPTGNQGNYINWIFKNVNLKNEDKKIRWPEDKERTREALKFFHDLKPSERAFNEIPQDINQLDLRALEAAKRQVHGHPDLPEFSGEGSLPEGSSFYAHEAPFEVVKIGGPGVDIKLGMAAACTLGEGTSWCTRDGAEAAKSYLQRGPLFVIYKNGNPYAQFHHGKDGDTQLMDVYDNPITFRRNKALFELLYKLNLMPKAMYIYEMLTRTGHPDYHEKGTPQQEQEIAKNPKYAYKYAENILGERFPLGEQAIAKDSDSAYKYAKNILNEPWPPGEPAIAKDPETAVNYARLFIRGPWPPGEPAIAKDSTTAYYYASDILDGPWPPGEPAIATDPLNAYFYARSVIRGPWPPGEPVLASRPEYGLRYAVDVLKDPEPHTWSKRYLEQHSTSEGVQSSRVLRLAQCLVRVADSQSRTGRSVTAMKVHDLGSGKKSKHVHFIAFRENLWVGSWGELEEASEKIIEMVLAGHPRREKVEQDISYIHEDACNFVKDYIPDAVCGQYNRETRQIYFSSGFSVPSSPMVRKVTEALRARSVEQEFSDDTTQVYKRSQIKGEWAWKRAFYHGTSSEYFEGIVRFGLRPMPHQTNYTQIVHDDAIFLTNIWDEAASHAFHTSRGAYNAYRGRFAKNFIPMMVSVTVPDPALVIPDYDVDLSADEAWYNHTSDPQSFYSVGSEKASKHAGLFGYTGRIPAKFIRALYFYSFDNKEWMRLTPDKFAKAVSKVQDQGDDFWYSYFGYPNYEG